MVHARGYLPRLARFALALVVLILWAMPAIAGTVNASSLRDGETYDQFIVRFREGAPERTNATSRQRTLNAVGRGSDVALAHRLHLAVGADVIQAHRKLDRRAAERMMRRLAHQPGVEYVELDATARMFQVTPYYPSDPDYPKQWQFDPMGNDPGRAVLRNMEYAWGESTGNGITVAVLDTGSTPHHDLHYVYGGYDFITDPYLSRDANGRDGNPQDQGTYADGDECGTDPELRKSVWHGTHVTGIINATTNIQGLVGMAFGAIVTPIRVLGRCGVGRLSDFADAIVWAAGGTVAGVPANIANSAEVINLSWGATGACSFTMQAAIDSAVASGTVVVAAAGNDHIDASLVWPANCDHVITVGAMARDAPASYSNFGHVIDVAAPGGESESVDPIWSTYNDGIQGPASASFTGLAGTSMAAAHVSALVAMMQSAYVSTPAVVESVLKSTADYDTGACDSGGVIGAHPACGHGIISPYTAIYAVLNPTLVTDDAVVTEGQSGTKLVNFTLDLTRPRAQATSYTLSTADGTATAGSDYVARAGATQTIQPGQTRQNFVVIANGDTGVEPDEDFFVNLAPVVVDPLTDAYVPSRRKKVTLLNDDGLSIRDASVAEGNSGTAALAFKVELSKALPTPVTFRVTTGNFDDVTDATAGSDYTPLDPSHTYTLPANQASLAISVPVLGDYADEPNEQLFAALTNVAGAVVVDGDAWGTILNDDGPRLSVGDVSLAEGIGGTKTMRFPVEIYPLPAADVTYWYASTDASASSSPTLSNKDFTRVDLHWQTHPANQRYSYIDVPILGDSDTEQNEVLYMNVYDANQDVSVFDGQGTGLILNDDGCTLSIGDLATTEGNSGTKLVTYTVKLSYASCGPVRYDIATANGPGPTGALAGTDYVAKSLVGETIASGQTAKTFTVTLNGDTTIEPNELVYVNLKNAVNATLLDAQANVFVINDDGPTLSIGDVTTLEGNVNKTIAFTVSLSKPATAPVTFTLGAGNGTALAGSDFLAPSGATQTLPVGTLNKSVAMTIIGDTGKEANETFTVSITSASGATIADATALGTITNDD
jgi:serine protease